MRRGSTPTNTFLTDIDLSNATVYVSYEQKGQTVLEKTGTDLTFAPGTEQGTYTITLELTQADTLKFLPGTVLIQIRYVFPDGSADASNIIQTSAERIIKDGEISYV